MKTFGKGLLGVACAVGMMLGATSLTGCAANKKKSDLAMQEATELRSRNDELTQANRDKDARIAELEMARATQPVQQQAPQIVQVPAAPPQPAQNNQNWDNAQPSEPVFHRGDDGNMRATIAGNVLFDSGKATLKNTAKAELDKVVKELKNNYSGAALRVEGHTDSDPIKHSNWKSNDQLSQARADAVMRYISSKGIKADRITSIGYGSSQPKGSKAASRRVEIVVTH